MTITEVIFILFSVTAAVSGAFTFGFWLRGKYERMMK